jgi:hypothetical protein
MPRYLTSGNYAVFIFDERGQPHHEPHAHIKHRGQRVASIFLVTLELFDVCDRVPAHLLEQISDHQQALLAAWQELNRE